MHRGGPLRQGKRGSRKIRKAEGDCSIFKKEEVQGGHKKGDRCSIAEKESKEEGKNEESSYLKLEEKYS